MTAGILEARLAANQLSEYTLFGHRILALKFESPLHFFSFLFIYLFSDFPFFFWKGGGVIDGNVHLVNIIHYWLIAFHYIERNIYYFTILYVYLRIYIDFRRKKKYVKNREMSWFFFSLIECQNHSRTYSTPLWVYTDWYFSDIMDNSKSPRPK